MGQLAKKLSEIVAFQAEVDKFRKMGEKIVKEAKKLAEINDEYTTLADCEKMEIQVPDGDGDWNEVEINVEEFDHIRSYLLERRGASIKKAFEIIEAIRSKS